MKEPGRQTAESADLTPEQRSLYRKLLEREGIAAPAGNAPLATTNPREAEIPLSYAQRRMWFFEQKIEVNHAYTIAWVFRLEGGLDVAAFEASYNFILNRHEVLRIICRTVDHLPVQEILPTRHQPIPVIDVSDLPADRRIPVADRLTGQIAGTAYDLSIGPLFLIDLIKIASDDHYLVIRGHHYVLDSWSADILLDELGTFYDDYRRGREPSPPTLTLSYIDFARQEIARTESEEADRQLAYWKRILEDAPLRLDLQLPSARPASLHYEGAKHFFRIESEHSKAFRRLCCEEGVTLFMGMQAVFQALLHRYTGREKVIVGIAVSNRYSSETEGMVGSFANTLALCVSFTGDPSFRELLARVRKVNTEAMAHVDVPFDGVVREVNPVRAANYDPIVQVMFMVHGTPQQEVLKLEGIRVTRLRAEKGGSRMDLMFELVTFEDHFLCWLEHRSDLFERQTIARMAQHLQRLFNGIVADPDLPVSQLEVLAPHELSELDGAPLGDDGIDFTAERRHLLFGADPLPPLSKRSLPEALGNLWRQALGRADIGHHENLWVLDPTAVAREAVRNSVNACCGIALTSEEFFADSTVAGQVMLIEAALLSRAGALSDPEALRTLSELCGQGAETPWTT